MHTAQTHERRSGTASLPIAGSPHPFSGWLRHPAAIAARTLELAVDEARIAPGALVVDPFAGTARVGTYVCGRGNRFVGLEAHPITAEVAAAKFSRPAPPDDLRREARRVATFAASTASLTRLLGEHDVLVRSVDPDALAFLVEARDHVRESPGPWTVHLTTALLGTLRDSAGGGWPVPRPRPRARPLVSPQRSFIERVDAMADDLATAPQRPDGAVLCADSRTAAAWTHVTPGSAGGCVTSPPYLNGISYAEAPRLEALFLGRADSWSSLLALAGPSLVACCSQQAHVQRAVRARQNLSAHPKTWDAVDALTRRLTVARKQRPRGKAYDRLLWCYFADMAAVLEHLLTALAPGARSALVIGDSAPYGVRVDTPSLLTNLAEELGARVRSDCVLRSRGSRWPAAGSRHSQQLEERLVVLERPACSEQQPLPGL